MKNDAHSLAQAYKDNAEPLIDEMLRDPIVMKLMQSDNVSPEFINRLRSQVQSLESRLVSGKTH